MQARVALLNLATSLLAACREDGDVPWRWEAGDPCRSTSTRCLDELTQTECQGGVWVDVDCAEVCARDQAGVVSTGCVVDCEPRGACACAPATGAECEPGAARCSASGDALESCTKHQQWASGSCQELCAAGVMPLESLGCEATAEGAACRCSAEALPCAVDGAAECASEQTLAVCQGGIWVFGPCPDNCPPASAPSCDPLAPGGPACVCTDA